MYNFNFCSPNTTIKQQILNTTIDNLIIGTGPAGLAVAGRMKNHNIPFTIIEQTNRIANRWHNHYDRLHLHTVKQLSHLPHLPFPKTYPLYVPRKKFVEYLENYAQHFDIKPIFNQEVVNISKSSNSANIQSNGWTVLTKSNKTYTTKNVIVATGINRIPFLPKWQGDDTFDGTIIHSYKYKNAKPFLGQNILVVGMGNTGAELALDLAENGCNTYLSVRNPVNIVPRDFLGNPVQLTSKRLAKLPFGIGDKIGSLVQKYYVGNIEKHGLKISKIPPVEQLKIHRKTPIIDIGTLDAIKKGKIKIVPDIDHVYPKGVAFKNGTKVDFDSILLATGYKSKVENFIEQGEKLLNKWNSPQSAIATDFHKGLFFVGFDNNKLGGILGTIYTDSEKIVKAISNGNVQ